MPSSWWAEPCMVAEPRPCQQIYMSFVLSTNLFLRLLRKLRSSRTHPLLPPMDHRREAISAGLPESHITAQPSEHKDMKTFQLIARLGNVIAPLKWVVLLVLFGLSLIQFTTSMAFYVTLLGRAFCATIDQLPSTYETTASLQSACRDFQADQRKRSIESVFLRVECPSLALNGLLLATVFVLRPKRMGSLQLGMSHTCWTCTCGYEAWDDYLEYEPGSLGKDRSQSVMQSSLREPMAHTGFKSYTSSVKDVWQAAIEALFPSSNKDLPSHNGPNQNPSQTGLSGQTSTSNSTTAEPVRFLLLCMPWKQHANRLLNIDVTRPVSDADFFRLLRSVYTSSRGRCRRLASLRGLKSIRFVQFEVFRHDLADVRRYDVVPPDSQAAQYTYSPMPADFEPPIGQNQLRHLYDHPDHADTISVCFSRVPKKLHTRLVAAPMVGSSSGWGICFVEGVSWVRVCVLGLLGLLASTLFGILWSVLKQDIQGGFGVASWMLAVLALSIGALQGALEA